MKCLDNILCWYPFKDNKKIIEIFEDRPTINNDNIKHTNSFIIENKFKYDYIIVSKNISNIYSIVSDLKKSLNKNGHIILLINNRLSASSICNIPYNINNRKEEKNSFSKKEIIDNINKLFKNYYFYYPYPSYSNPIDIYTDESINKKYQVENHIPTKYDEISLVDEKSFNKALVSGGIADCFANSFIVDMCDKNDFYKKYYMRMHLDNDEKYSILTIVDKTNKNVVKKPLSDKAKEHLIKMEKNNWRINRIENLKYNWNTKNSYLSCKYLDSNSLNSILNTKVNNNSFDDYYNILFDFRDSLYIGEQKEAIDNPDFNKVFGTEKPLLKLHWLEKANIDLNFDNIFPIKNKYIVIDNEWCFDFPIPAEYCFWLAYNSYLSSNKKINISHDKFLDTVKIDKETEDVFIKWSEYFRNNYVGGRTINDSYDLYQIDNIINELNSIKNSKAWKMTAPIRTLFDILKGNRGN